MMTRIVCSALVVVALVGCAGETGPKKAVLNGAVTYKGQPVPKGEITFEPDTTKGNSGPGTVGRIENGAYDLKGGMGVVGGPHIVRITGFDGVPDGENSDGKLLFQNHEIQIDLPKESGKQDFNIQ